MRFMKTLRAACSTIRLLAAASLLFTGMSSLSAQTATQPVASLRFADVTTIAMNQDGSHLLVGEGDSETVRLYDTTSTTPDLIREVALEGTPVASAWISRDDRDFALVVVNARGAPLLQVIAQDASNPRAGWISYAIFDLALAPDAITTSTTGEWAAVYGDDGLVLLEIVSGGEVNSLLVTQEPTNAVALTGSMLLVVHSAATAIAGLASGPRLLDAPGLTTSDPLIALVGISGAMAGGLSDAPATLLIDPEQPVVTSTLPIRGQADSLAFLPLAANDALAVYQSGSRAMALIPVIRGRAGTAASITVARAIRIISGGGPWLVTSDGATVDLYAVR